MEERCVYMEGDLRFWWKGAGKIRENFESGKYKFIYQLKNKLFTLIIKIRLDIHLNNKVHRVISKLIKSVKRIVIWWNWNSKKFKYDFKERDSE